mmetsp:Transcript_55695/g.156258  ORF Transcript_55695/g.156258 Transcript_55695/m.156258 type:complete len:205 (-) Transcript_55695:98-712(-)
MSGQAEDPLLGRRKAAGARHDTFNLVFIPPLVALTILSLLLATDTLHYLLTWSVLGYVVLDILYHLVDPYCQPDFLRWATIVFHHLVVVWLAAHPLQQPQNLSFTAWATIVEVNTVCQVFNRAFKLKIFRIGFLVTWFGLRLIWYPVLIYSFHGVLMRQGVELFSHTYCQVVGSQVLLVMLNAFWTAEFLLAKKPQEAAKDKAT